MGSCQCSEMKESNEKSKEFTVRESLNFEQLSFFSISLNPKLFPQGKPKLCSAEDVLRVRINALGRIYGFSHRKKVKKQIVTSNMSGLLTTLQYAYSNQYHLALRPIDFLVSIIQGIGYHINEKKELIHNEFYMADDLCLDINENDFCNIKTNQWNPVIERLFYILENKMRPPLLGIIEDGSSDSSPLSKISSMFSLLSPQLKQGEVGIQKASGFPSITLKGTKEDWNKLRTKVQQLMNLNELDKLMLDWWLKYLNPVIEKICSEYGSANPDLDFWQKFFIIQESEAGTFVQGWINVFLPYSISLNGAISNQYVDWEKSLEDPLSGLLLQEAPPGISECKVRCKPENFECKFFAGFIGAKYEANEMIHPELFWAAIEDNDNEQEILFISFLACNFQQVKHSVFNNVLKLLEYPKYFPKQIFRPRKIHLRQRSQGQGIILKENTPRIVLKIVYSPYES